jgi:hypothetical protein
LSDVRIIVSLDVAEEVHHVVIGGVGNVDVAKEYNDISFNHAVGIHVAKETDCVVNGGIPGDMNGTAELDFVFAGVCREGKRSQCGREQTEIEQATFHDVSFRRYAQPDAKVPGGEDRAPADKPVYLSNAQSGVEEVRCRQVLQIRANGGQALDCPPRRSAATLVLR